MGKLDDRSGTPLARLTTSGMLHALANEVANLSDARFATIRAEVHNLLTLLRVVVRDEPSRRTGSD